MSGNYPNIKERILLFAEKQEVSKQEFFRKTGLKYSNFTGKSKDSDLASHSINEILLIYPHLNTEWLITGKGEMVKQQSGVEVRTLRTNNHIDQQLIPLYDLNATASVVDVFGDAKVSIPVDHIRIPNLPKCDGAIHIKGDSMYPLLKSGDIVLYREVQDKQNIVWGEMYLIYIQSGGDEFFFCKYIHHSEREGYVKFVSQNKHHQPVEFSIESIKQLAIVNASIRVNSAI